MNHRDGAVGVVDQPGADEQAATQRAAAPAPDHLGLLGQLDKCRRGRRKEQFRLDLGPSTFCGAVFDELDRVGHDLCGFVFLPWVGQDRAGELTAGVDTTCTGVSGTLRTVASCAAYRTATLDDGEPSTPTKTPGCAGPLDIRFASYSDRLP